MRHPSRPRALALTALALAAVQVVEALRYLADAPYLSVLLFVAALFGAVASVKLWRRDAFGPRFIIAVIALGTVAGQALALTAGLPGSTMGAWTGSRGAVGFISLATAMIILVMLLPHIFGKSSGSGPPYDSRGAAQNTPRRG